MRNCFSIKKKGTEVSTRTAELYSVQGNTDSSVLMVIDEMVQRKIQKESP